MMKQEILMLTVLLLMAHGSAHAIAPATPRDHNKLATGYTETYKFTMNGKSIGSETASLTNVTTGGVQAWSFDTDLTLPTGDDPLHIKEAGTFAITDTGYPQWIKVQADIPSGHQEISLDLTAPQAKLSGSINGSPISVSVPFQRGQFLTLNNNITLLSLALQSVHRPDDGTNVTLPALSVDANQPITMTLAPMGKENVGNGDKAVLCSIYDVTPIYERFWLDASSGAIVKVEDTRQGLIIMRQ